MWGFYFFAARSPCHAARAARRKIRRVGNSFIHRQGSRLLRRAPVDDYQSSSLRQTHLYSFNSPANRSLSLAPPPSIPVGNSFIHRRGRGKPLPRRWCRRQGSRLWRRAPVDDYQSSSLRQTFLFSDNSPANRSLSLAPPPSIPVGNSFIHRRGRGKPLPRRWCRRQGSNLHGRPRDSKSRASANSATAAKISPQNAGNLFIRQKRAFRPPQRAYSRRERACCPPF